MHWSSFGTQNEVFALCPDVIIVIISLDIQVYKFNLTNRLNSIRSWHLALGRRGNNCFRVLFSWGLNFTQHAMGYLRTRTDWKVRLVCKWCPIKICLPYSTGGIHHIIKRSLCHSRPMEQTVTVVWPKVTGRKTFLCNPPGFVSTTPPQRTHTPFPILEFDHRSQRRNPGRVGKKV